MKDKKEEFNGIDDTEFFRKIDEYNKRREKLIREINDSLKDLL